MEHRFKDSITSEEIQDFKRRLSDVLAECSQNGERLLTPEDIQREVNDNLSKDDIRQMLTSCRAVDYNYTTIAISISAKYRIYSTAAVRNTREKMVAIYLDHAKKHNWNMEIAKRDAQSEFYDNLTDTEVIDILKSGQSISSYVEFVCIYG